MDLISIIYIISFSFIISITTSGCSRSNHHFEFLYEDGLTTTSEDHNNIYECEIVPWLRNHLSETEITNLNLETINRRGRIIPDRPVFKDHKLLFELAELLFTKGLNNFGLEVLQYIRSRIFLCSTYSVLIASLNLDLNNDLGNDNDADGDNNLIIFNQVLKLWFPTGMEIINAILNIVDLRMGEDESIMIIDLVWDRLLKSVPREKLYIHFSFILRIAMRNHYVSVFEDILERLPKMIRFTILRGDTIVHQFCYNLSPILLNQLYASESVDARSESSDHSSISILYDHRIRFYPTANFDLLKVMKLHGADIEERERSGMTPLHFAVFVKNHHIVNVLLRSGADYNASYLQYSMKEWIKKNHDEQVEKVFDDFFKEQKEKKQEKREREREAEKKTLRMTNIK